MAPKTKPGVVPLNKLSVLDETFPVWNDAFAAFDAKEQGPLYEDLAGLALPPETMPYLDAWKRPDELVMNMPNLPIVITKPATPPADAKELKAAKGAPPPVSRDLEGSLWSGHKTFEWLQAVFTTVISVSKALKPGEFLWELIYPRDPKDGSHVKPPSGKYKVKLFIMDQWRSVTIDDRIPVDLFGRTLLVGIRPLQLWPLILSKAILKNACIIHVNSILDTSVQPAPQFEVMAAMRILHLELPHQVAAFCALTGWPQEDLLDVLAGPRLQGGFLFDRLEDAVRGNDKIVDRRAVATVCLRKRAIPEKPPPRIIVLCGPSAVGRSKLARQLLEEFPDKFGTTVSHTSRRPREHEVHGRDYFFTDKADFLSETEAGKMLEWAPVHKVNPPRAGEQAADPEAYLYGTSIATVREVAATGKLCIMGLNESGVGQLQANKRIDGMYVYIAPPSLGVLEERMRGRLMEADSTIQQRISWASSQMQQAAKPGVFEHVVLNTEFDAVYHALKEAISTLSPIIRNRLRGLPAYVLDYSDLIPPNLVEKPFLKPVLLAGPNTGERFQLMELLVREFPDVFAFPRTTTTRPKDEAVQFKLTVEELEEQEDRANKRATPPKPVAVNMLPPPTPPLTRKSAAIPGASVAEKQEGTETPEAGAGAGGEKADKEDAAEHPEPNVVSAAEFDQLVSSGALLVHQSDLFVHSMAQHRSGYTMDAIKEVIKAGKLPLLDLEAEGVATFKQKGIDSLSIFLQPPSEEVFKERLISWLTETDDQIAARMAAAAAQIETAQGSSMFDAVLVNDDLEATYYELKAMISKVRPDIIMPEEERLALEAAAGQGTTQKPQPILVVAGPSRAGREALVTQLCTAFPGTFEVPTMVTDRKPAKGEVATEELQFVSAKELTKMGADGLLAMSRAGDGGVIAVKVEALHAVTKANKVAIIDLPDSAVEGTLAAIKSGTHTAGALYVFIASPAAAAAEAAVPGAPPAQDSAVLQAAAEAARADGQFDLVVSEGADMELVSAVRAALSAHVPDVVPPPYKPLVVAGPFGTGKRVLLRRLFESLPGKFAAPVMVTTKTTDNPEVDERAEMRVVSQGEAAAMVESGAFLVRGTALGHTYGVERAAVKRVQASGKVCVVEVDRVEDVKKLRAEGFDAVYVYVGVSSMDDLLRRVHAEIVSNPPLGYEPDEASAKFFATAKAEVLASKEEGLFDEWVDNGSDAVQSFGCLSEAVHRHYPSVVVAHFVFGYGRGLWDRSVRKHGQHPLRVMVLGPAASGKTVMCEQLAVRYGLPHINVGDLLYDDVARKTALGLEAKVFMDDSKTVPDKYFLELVALRVQQPDCVVSGWLLDGFPHTEEQAMALQRLGLVPDKVVFLTASQSVLLDRTRYRRIDMDTNRVYHMATEGALSQPIRPLTKDGVLDQEVVARLHPRHDDSEENVMARLDLWDLHYENLRAAYEDVSLRVPVDTGALPDEALMAAASFLGLESSVSDIEVVPSHSLKELQYEVVDALRYKRAPLLRLKQEDGKMFWVDTRELCSNAHCLLLGRDPSTFEVMQVLRRLDLDTPARTALLYINSPEPSQVLMTLALGPQSALEDLPKVPRKVLAVCGPCGVGKTTAITMLLADNPDRLERVTPLTTRPRHKGEHDTQPFIFTTPNTLRSMHAKGQLASNVIAEYDGAQYALPLAALQASWDAGRIPVYEAPFALATALRAATTPALASAPTPTPPATPPAGVPKAARGAAPPKSQPPPPSINTIEVVCVYLTASIGQLDVRMREVGQLEEEELQHQLVLANQELAEVEVGVARFIAARNVAQMKAANPPVAPTPPPAAGGPAAARSTMEASAAKAAAVAAAAAALEAAGRAPPDVPDHVLPNMDRSPMLVYHEVKDVAASLWHRPRVPVPCQLLLEDYDWHSTVPGLTRKRMRTLMASGTTLDVPRGKHLLRVTAAPEYLHQLTLYVAPQCDPEEYQLRANELSQVLPMDEESKATVVQFDGEFATLPQAGASAALLRFNLKATQTTTMVASLSISNELARACTRISLVDNESGTEVMAHSGRLVNVQLEPHDKGYTLLAICTPVPKPLAAAPVDSSGTWFLQLITSAPLASAQETSVARSQMLGGMYRPNKGFVLARHLLTPLNTVQVALVASTEPPLPFRLSVHQARTGAEVVWGTEYPVRASTSTLQGSAVIPNTVLAPGKYLVHMELNPDECPGGWQLDPLTGEISSDGQPVPAGSGNGSLGDAQTDLSQTIKWKLVYMTSTDDKMCPITEDQSQQKYYKGLQDTWGQAGVPQLASLAVLPAAGGKTAPVPKGPAKGATAPVVSGARAAAAAQLLEKVLAEMAGGGPEATSSPAPSALPSSAPTAASDAGAPPHGVLTHTAKDGSVIQLFPDKHVHHKPMQAGKPVMALSEEALADSIAAVEAVAAEKANVAAAIEERLGASKAHNDEIATRKQTTFGAWRKAAATTNTDLLKARASAIKAVKQAAATAKAAIATELASAAANRPL